MAALPALSAEDGLPVESPLGVRSLAFSAAQLAASMGVAIVAPGRPRFLRALVLVHGRSACRAGLEPVSVSGWPAELMPSVDGAMSRRLLFTRLVSLAAKRGVEVLRLDCATAREGATILVSRFLSG